MYEGGPSPRFAAFRMTLSPTANSRPHISCYDFSTQKWTQWLHEPGNLAYPTWTRDGKYVYFENFLTDHPTARRVKLGAASSESLYSLSDLHPYQGTASGVWTGSSPDGSRLYVRDLSAQEVYALDVEFP